MRKLVPIIALLIIGCEADDPWTGTVQLDEPFNLPYNGIAIVEGQGLEITFESVEEDSRCPPDVECIWEGRVVIQLILETDSQGKTILFLGTNWSDSEYTGSLDTLGYRISLLGVEPPPARSTASIPVENYVLKLEVMESWIEGTIILFDADSYLSYLGRTITVTARDTLWVDGDSLFVPVQYSGGCNEHDFYLIGTCPADSAALTISLFHDGHNDACDAWLSDTLKFDLAPLWTCGLAADSLALSFINDTTTVMFGL